MYNAPTSLRPPFDTWDLQRAAISMDRGRREIGSLRSAHVSGHESHVTPPLPGAPASDFLGVTKNPHHRLHVRRAHRARGEGASIYRRRSVDVLVCVTVSAVIWPHCTPTSPTCKRYEHASTPLLLLTCRNSHRMGHPVSGRYGGLRPCSVRHHQPALTALTRVCRLSLYPRIAPRGSRIYFLRDG